jgi:hypothetical protein
MTILYSDDGTLYQPMLQLSLACRQLFLFSHRSGRWKRDKLQNEGTQNIVRTSSVVVNHHIMALVGVMTLPPGVFQPLSLVFHWRSAEKSATDKGDWSESLPGPGPNGV